ncbi:unnamed protein product [Fraxinus pennsylvanica]|uniref:Uncharacterized protein n=1 Tax=Fraxinus pennsylvanica TaxID=56036 RepID=A0AAD2E615_9LAMI|nr:unnamed protein product [Fraxinus pennsylvanica]
MLGERNKKGVKGECIFSGNLVEHAACVGEMTAFGALAEEAAVDSGVNAVAIRIACFLNGLVGRGRENTCSWGNSSTGITSAGEKGTDYCTLQYNAKTVGLVSFPGAMTGLITIGASPLEAIQLQIVVTNMLFGASTVSSFMSTYLCWLASFTKAYRLQLKVFSSD